MRENPPTPDPNAANAATSKGDTIISTNAVSRVFGSGENAVVAVDQVTLEVRSGEFFALTGRSGSGKTTLLNLMAGLDQPTGGHVVFEGRDLAALSEKQMVELRRHKIGFIFQSFGLIPLLSAYENVELPLHISGTTWRERRRRAIETLHLVGLGPRAKHRPYELSGGEQQRVAIARALVTGPDVLFADEPTGELDTVTAISIAAILKDITQKQGVTVIVATHDQTLSGICDRVLIMEDGALVDSGQQA
ncbi:MAG: ABC transporter ATP-binding protein [Chloroflexi bacterium]|nr:ABC transporter ATP-binding protein [Chloroflexota bacterium]